MQPHVKNYFKAHGYDRSDTILCENCGCKAVEIHHINPRSHYGSKRRLERDSASNLVALCRDCHDKAHGPLAKEFKEKFETLKRNKKI